MSWQLSLHRDYRPFPDRPLALPLYVDEHQTEIAGHRQHTTGRGLIEQVAGQSLAGLLVAALTAPISLPANTGSFLASAFLLSGI